jgi:hypothetical protein
MRIVVGEAWKIGIAVAGTFSSKTSSLSVLCGLDSKSWVVVVVAATMGWVGRYEGMWSEYSVGLVFRTGVPYGVGNESKIESEETFVDTKL